jgi:glyoxylase-like metal-dependent hydrolase (beta-lactamase superfamily II)
MTLVTTTQPWYEVRRVDPGIFIIEEPYHYEQVKSYLIEGEAQALLLDTGTGAGDMRALVGELTDLPVFLVSSHAHLDHIGCNSYFGTRWIHEAEAKDLRLIDGVPNERYRKLFAPEGLTGPLPDGFDVDTAFLPPAPPTDVMEDGHRFDLGGRVLEVLHLPGHSPGGIALLDRESRALFSADIAYGGVLYVFNPADLPTYHDSLQRLAGLAGEIDVVYPAHDASPIGPDILPRMAEAIDKIIGGMQPAGRQDDMAQWQFDGFAVRVWGMPEP